MRTVFSSVLAASLLVHAALGCCWHKSQDTCECDGTHRLLAVASECDHDHDAAPEGDRHDSHQPGKGQSHCPGTCNYLPVQKSQLGKIQILAPVDTVAVVPLTCQAQVVSYFAAEPTGGRLEPPLRLHLLHQIILV
jgi:hypothetical protein